MATVTLTQWITSFVPVLVLFAAIAFFKLKVPTAAVLGLVVSLITATVLGAFEPALIGNAASTGLVTALSILYAIWPAMFLYDIMRESGAFAHIRTAVCALTQDRLIVVLMFAWILASFLQSISGFGVPVAVCAPFLVALGIPPVPAIIMTLVGHAWGNTYGTLGMAWDALVSLGPLQNVAQGSLYTGVLLWFLNLSGALIICAIYGKGAAVLHGLPFVLLISTIMGGGQTLVGQFDQTTAAFIPSTLAIVVSVALFKLGVFTKPWDTPSSLLASRGAENDGASAPAGSSRQALLATAPFAFLALISLVVFNIPAVGNALARFEVAGVTPFKHAGFVLAATALFAYALMRREGALDGAGTKIACQLALKKLYGASAGIILLVIMAKTLQVTGQMHLLALGVAQAAGPTYVPFAPAVGTLGAFVTSSNMSSNILLAGFQNGVATNLGLSSSLMLAAQTAGGAAGAIIGPSTILLGASTAGASGKEGQILKPLLAISLTQALIIGVLVWVASMAL